MLYIDAREGVSGDMLLAAMLAVQDADRRRELARPLEKAAIGVGLGMALAEIEDAGERGLGISYTQPEPSLHGVSHDECFTLLKRIERDLGSHSDIGARILDLIFEAESEVHKVPVPEVHLHEIGRPQALLNIAGIGMLASSLLDSDPDGFASSTIVTGTGMVVVAHGAVRIPAPASASLLSGLKHEPGTSPGERATPTGIAAVKVLAKRQTDDVPQRFTRKGIGFGTKRFAGRLGRTRLLWA